MTAINLSKRLRRFRRMLVLLPSICSVTPFYSLLQDHCRVNLKRSVTLRMILSSLRI